MVFAQIAPSALPPCAAAVQLAIKNVQLVNVLTGAIETGSTITIGDGRICSIVPDDRADVAAGTAVIDGRGRYAIPALWDLYTPPNRATLLRQLVGFGIAHVLAAGAAAQDINEWQHALQDARAAAPTIYTTLEPSADRPDDKFRVAPGADLHDALALLVARGVSAIDALRSATLAPASAAGVVDHVGVLAPGYEASLLLLEGNPLDDISQTRRASLMLLRGEPLGLRQLARLRLAR